MLKKSVCKKCRKKELGKGSWNSINESWFNPYYENGKKIREGKTVCPYHIFDRIGERIKRKVLSNATPAEKFMVEEDFIIVKNMQNSWPWPVKSKPPIWCPYKKEHK